MEKASAPRPPMVLDENDFDLDSVSEISRSIIQGFKEAVAFPTQGVYDKRFGEFELSPAHKMLEAVGLMPSKPARAGRSKPRKEFVRLYGKIPVDGLDGDEQKPFTQRTMERYQAIVAGACVIIGTDAIIASKAVLDIIRTTCTAFFLEEDPHIAELYRTSSLGWHFTRDPVIVAVGGPNQYSAHVAALHAERFGKM